MKLIYSDLPSLKVQKLVINSLEQSLYQAIVVVDGQEHIVWESDAKTLTMRNLAKMRELFECMDIPEIVLRQESAFDEMVGLEAGSQDNRMEVPLGKIVYPAP